MDAQTLPVVTSDLLARAISAEPVLRAIVQGGHTSQRSLFEACGRDPKNASRDLAALEEIGLIARGDTAKDMPSLTPLAVAALEAIDRAANPGETVSPAPTLSPLQISILSWINDLPKATATLLAMQVGLPRPSTSNSNSIIDACYRLEGLGLVSSTTEGTSPCGHFCEPVYSLTDQGRWLAGPANLDRHPTHAPHAYIAPNPNQPRKTFDDEALDELAASLLVHGQMQNLVVRPMQDAAGAFFQIVGGERRWRAFGRLIQREEIAADFPIRIEVRELTDEQVAVLALVENLQRQDLDFYERALAFEALHKEHGWPTAKIATENRISQKTVQMALTFAKATAAEVEAVRNGKPYRQVVAEINARPKPIELLPQQALILAEVIAAANPNKAAEYWRGAPVAGPQVADAIEAAGLTDRLAVRGPSYQFGLYEVVFKDGYTTFGPLCAAIGGGIAGMGRPQALLAVRARAAGADAAEEAETSGRFLTDWLNGPFELTAEGRAKVEEFEAVQRQQAVTQAKQQADLDLRRKAVAETKEKAARLFDFHKETPVAANTMDVVTDLLTQVQAPLPWSYRPDPEGGDYPGELLDANGETINFDYRDDGDLLSHLIMAVMNAAVGKPPIFVPVETGSADNQAPSTDPSADDYDGDLEAGAGPEFWTWVAARLERMWSVTAERALALAGAAERRLEEAGEAYADESRPWTMDDAVTIADDYAQDFPDELGDPEDPEALGEFEEDEEAA